MVSGNQLVLLACHLVSAYVASNPFSRDAFKREANLRIAVIEAKAWAKGNLLCHREHFEIAIGKCVTLSYELLMKAKKPTLWDFNNSSGIPAISGACAESKCSPG